MGEISRESGCDCLTACCIELVAAGVWAGVAAVVTGGASLVPDPVAVGAVSVKGALADGAGSPV